MSNFYEQMLNQVAKPLLNEFDQGGIELVRTTRSGPAYNPTTQSTMLSLVGAVRGVSQQYVDGTHVVETDLELTTPGDIVVNSDDKISLSGVLHQIVKVIPKPATGVTVATTLVIRK